MQKFRNIMKYTEKQRTYKDNKINYKGINGQQRGHIKKTLRNIQKKQTNKI